MCAENNYEGLRGGGRLPSIAWVTVSQKEPISSSRCAVSGQTHRQQAPQDPTGSGRISARLTTEELPFGVQDVYLREHPCLKIAVCVENDKDLGKRRGL